MESLQVDGKTKAAQALFGYAGGFNKLPIGKTAVEHDQVGGPGQPALLPALAQGFALVVFQEFGWSDAVVIQ
jgi:hypothetical protein